MPADAHPPAPWDETTGPPPTSEPTAAHSSGDIGQLVADRYKLLERIGEGGMGTVWMAEQRQPVKRLVAVKLIKPGLDTGAVLARFEAERQALAIMDHPNIARVLDAGETSDQRPFFVMELVRGVPITRYCDDARLSTRQRLELFVPVCQAIQHAHTKGVIHRDIKPGNVLVAMYDGRPVPKVIDFGIAKATGQTLTDKTLHTEFGAVVGTPEYMSPEQASFNQLDVDTRSDVYALGVLLYELLTGGPPFTHRDLATAGLLEMLRVVREHEPPRPSVKLSTATGLAALAATRNTEPARLAGLVRGEVDWIVMKALEKDRNRRYETATGLAADVRRHLDGEPVQAVPPSVGYRVRKLVRRHRAKVLVAATVLLSLVAGLAGTTWQAVRATRAEQAARAAEAEAMVQAEASKMFASLAGKQTRRAEMATADYRVDLDLAALTTDTRAGLLKLVGTRRYLSELATVRDGDVPDPEFTTHMADRRDLATLVTVAVGQTFAPLLPPLWPDGTKQIDHLLGPDNRTALSRDEAGVVRLWDILVAQTVIALRERDERVIRYGFSTAGGTVYTQDEDSVVRFWTLDGTLRGKTPLRLDRYAYPSDRSLISLESVALEANDLVVGDKTAVLSYRQFDLSNGGNWGGSPHGPNKLIDTATGRLINRLDRPGYGLDRIAFSPEGRLLTALEKNRDAYGRLDSNSQAQVAVFNADSGQALARIASPVSVDGVTVSPAGKWLLTETVHAPPHQPRWRLWDTRTWAEVRLPFLDWREDRVYFPTDELLVRGDTNGPISFVDAVHRIGGPTLSLRQNLLYGQFPVAHDGGDLLRYRGTDLLDGRTLTRLLPPPGRRFHPRLAEAAGGRFLRLEDVVADTVVDTRTQKVIDRNGGAFTGFAAGGVIPGADIFDWDGSTVRLLPKANRLAVPPDLLELWAQVAVRGELGPDGEFVPWNEETWRRKWEELAAAKPPYPDFPFPGHLARDPLHWHRKEYEAAADADQLPLARELLRRADAAGDAPEAARWRREVAKRVPEVAPPPRPAVH